MNTQDVLDEFRAAGALREGHFVLSSGLHSGTFLQKNLVFQYPERTERLCRALAAKIDAWDTIVQWALEDAHDARSRPTVPANDNTSLGTYARYLEQLGLTVPAAKSSPAKKASETTAPTPVPAPGRVSLSVLRSAVDKTG